MPVKKLKEYLDQKGVKYVSILHSRAYTAQEIAAATHIPGKELAKCVIVKIDDKIAMAVLPASHAIDLQRFKRELQAGSVEIAHEEEFKDLFPGVETGAMPPFGHLWGMETYVSDALSRDEIGFEAGSHNEVIKMAYADFERLAEPRVLGFSSKSHPAKRQETIYTA
ncbi:MAG: deacylase [Desulfobacteraceae bacterium]|nr:MAG: deacylase [Desulfobacteraceae bacterium]